MSHAISVALTLSPEVEALVTYAEGRVTSPARGHSTLTYDELEHILQDTTRFVHICEAVGVPTTSPDLPSDAKETLETDGDLKASLRIKVGPGRIDVVVTFDHSAKTVTFLPRPAYDVGWNEWLYYYHWLSLRLVQATKGW